MNSKKVAVVGAGAFGVAWAKTMADLGFEVALWSRSGSRTERLGSIQLPSNVQTLTTLAETLQNAPWVISTLPMSALREVWTLARPLLHPDAKIISTTKGVEPETLHFSSSLLLEVLGESWRNNLVFLSGPTFALEMAQRKPTALTLASESPAAAKAVQSLISCSFLRAYTTNDVIGVEVAGAFKNVIAIAAGIVDGMELGQNAKAALITRGLGEMTRLAVALGGTFSTLSGLSGAGDLMLTCYGTLSRNRQVGYELSRGKKLPDVIASLSQVAEGVYTAKSARELAERLNLQLPICDAVYRLIYEAAPVQNLLQDLMSRPLGDELE